VVVEVNGENESIDQRSQPTASHVPSPHSKEKKTLVYKASTKPERPREERLLVCLQADWLEAD
jgi:hypothetical protein